MALIKVLVGQTLLELLIKMTIILRNKALFTKFIHCKYQRYILTRCSVNLLVVFNTMVLKRVFFVIINTCVALI